MLAQAASWLHLASVDQSCKCAQAKQHTVPGVDKSPSAEATPRPQLEASSMQAATPLESGVQVCSATPSWLQVILAAWSWDSAQCICTQW